MSSNVLSNKHQHSMHEKLELNEQALQQNLKLQDELKTRLFFANSTLNSFTNESQKQQIQMLIKQIQVQLNESIAHHGELLNEQFRLKAGLQVKQEKDEDKRGIDEELKTGSKMTSDKKQHKSRNDQEDTDDSDSMPSEHEYTGELDDDNICNPNRFRKEEEDDFQEPDGEDNEEEDNAENDGETTNDENIEV